MTFQRKKSAGIAPAHQWTLYRSLWIRLSTATAALLTGDLALLCPLLLPEVSGTGWSHVKNQIIRFLSSPCLELPLLHWHGYFSRQPWPSNNPNVQKSIFTVNKELGLHCSVVVLLYLFHRSPTESRHDVGGINGNVLGWASAQTLTVLVDPGRKGRISVLDTACLAWKNKNLYIIQVLWCIKILQRQENTLWNVTTTEQQIWFLRRPPSRAEFPSRSPAQRRQD